MHYETVLFTTLFTLTKASNTLNMNSCLHMSMELGINALFCQAHFVFPVSSLNVSLSLTSGFSYAILNCQVQLNQYVYASILMLWYTTFKNINVSYK